jgi:hypothetical protein
MTTAADSRLRTAADQVIRAWAQVYPQAALKLGGNCDFRQLAAAMTALRRELQIDTTRSGQ